METILLVVLLSILALAFIFRDREPLSAPHDRINDILTRLTVLESQVGELSRGRTPHSAAPRPPLASPPPIPRHEPPKHVPAPSHHVPVPPRPAAIPASGIPPHIAAPSREPPPLPRHAPASRPASPFADHPSDTSFETTAETEKRTGSSFDWEFGVKLPVWIGAIAIILAGFFLIKYSIDIGLLNQKVRTVLAGILGVCLIGGGYAVSLKPDFANGERISQALAGAGTAILYGVLFIAAGPYQLIPPLAGFVGMAVVTITAVALAARIGMAMAFLGMVGGFLTPALIQTGNPNAAYLFPYLMFLTGGIMAIAHMRRWWGLGLISLGLAYFWAFIWIAHSSSIGDSGWVSGFLLVLTIMSGISSITAPDEEEATWSLDGESSFSAKKLIPVVGVVLSLIMMTGMSIKASFGLMDWGLFGILSAGTFPLSMLSRKKCAFAPWMAGIFVIIALIFQGGGTIADGPLPILIFGLLFASGGMALAIIGGRQIEGALMSSAASIAFFALAHFRLGQDYSVFFTDPADFWCAIAAVLFALHAMAFLIARSPDGNNVAAAILLVGATTFLTIAFALELQTEFLPVVFASEVLAISVIDGWLAVHRVRLLAFALSILMLLALFLPIAGLLQVALVGLAEHGVDFPELPEGLRNPLMVMGIPTLFMGLAGFLMKPTEEDADEGDKALPAYFSSLAILGTTATLYLFLRQVMHGFDENYLAQFPSFFERGLILNLFFLISLAALGLCIATGQTVWLAGASLIGVIALLRIVYFEIILHAWDPSGGDLPVMNGFLLTFGLPAIWTGILAKSRLMPSLQRLLNVSCFLLVFAWVTANVWHFFNESMFAGSFSTSLETFSYSLAWLVFALGLLWIGFINRSLHMRKFAIAALALTICKVFLYDASNLDDLLRILALFGLGFSLIGLSYFYTKFIRASEGDQEAAD